MVEFDETTVSCENCVAACCKAPIYMQLSNKEYKRHRARMDLEVVVAPNKINQTRIRPDGRVLEIPIGQGLYELRSGCANLSEEYRCSIYPERPRCCRELQVGSAECLRARRNAGLDDGPLPEDGTSTESQQTRTLVDELFPALASPANASVVVRPVAPSLDEICATLTHHGGWLTERLSACDAAEWSRRTRCVPWSVGTLAAHLVDGAGLANRVFLAVLNGVGARTPPTFRGDQDSTVAALCDARNALLDTVIRLTPNLLEREVSLDSVAAVSVSYLADTIATEFAVHALDVAHALSETRHLSADDIQLVAHALPDLLDVGVAPRRETSYLLRSLSFELALTWHGDNWRCDLTADPCTIDGEPEAVLLYALGRNSFDASRLSTNRPEQARAFKSYLPGP